MEPWDATAVADAFWRRLGEGVHFPQEWDGRLTIDQAYAVQLELMRRKMAQGRALAG